MVYINLPGGGSSNYKDPVASTGDLPTSGNADGDMRVVTNASPPEIYVWSTNTSSWELANPSGGGGGSTEFIDRYTLTPADIANKQLVLSHTPTSVNSVQLVVIGGPDQNLGTDFTVAVNILSWNGLTLEGLLEIGDELIVEYH